MGKILVFESFVQVNPIFSMTNIYLPTVDIPDYRNIFVMENLI